MTVENEQREPTMADEPGRLGLTFETTVEHTSTGAGPLLAAILDHVPYPGDGEQAFAPLRLPDRARLKLCDVDPRLISRARVTFRADLAEGEHLFPLAGGAPFKVCFAPGAQAVGAVEVAPAPPVGGHGPATALSDPDGGPIVRALDLEFRPAAVLPNILVTLLEVQHLFEDRAVATLLKTLTSAPAMLGLERSEPLRRLPGFALLADVARELRGEVRRRVRGVTGEPAEILLTRVRARPRRSSKGVLELIFAFSGQVRLLDRVTVPFVEVVLPAAILPVPHAGLDQLLSDRPLTTGELFRDRFDPLSAARAAVETLIGAQGAFSATVDLPAVGLEFSAVDRTRFASQVRVPRGWAVTADYRHERDDDRHHVDLTNVRVAFADHPGRLLTAAAHADVRLDLDTPDLDPLHRAGCALTVDLGEGAILPRLEIEARSTHPLADGGTAVHVVAEDLTLRGGLDVRLEGGHLSPAPTAAGLAFEGRFALPDQLLMQRARGRTHGALESGRIKGALRAEGAAWELGLEASGALHVRFDTTVSPIPELKIEDSRLDGRIDCQVSLGGKALVRLPSVGAELVVSPSGGLRVVLERAEAELDRRRIELPAGTEITGAWREGAISSADVGDFAVDLAWDLHGHPCLLHGPAAGGAAGERVGTRRLRRRGPVAGGVEPSQGSTSTTKTVSLLTPALREGELTVHVSPGGRLSFSGAREGLYGVRYFNALIDPGKEAEHLLEILNSDDALAHVEAALEVFNPELADLLHRVRAWALKIRDHIDREEIKQPGDVIPRTRIAHFGSLVLVGDDSLEARLTPLIKDVTEGRGMNLRAAKEVVRDAIGERGYDYEIDALLRWFDLVTKPSEPLPHATPVAEPPLVYDPHFAVHLADLPSADSIYATIAAGGVPHDFLHDVAALAPYLTIAQLDFVIARAEPHWEPAVLKRLRHVREAKRRVANIEAGYGGIAYAAQSAAIAGFLGEAIGPLPLDEVARASRLAGEADTTGNWPPPCALGPRDIGVVLASGLAEGHQGLQTQINNRLILDLLRTRPGEFLREVLIEMSQQVPRALVGILFAFLHQDQDELREPLDLVALLEEKLGMPVPRQEDFMAGGRKVRDSYYEALSHLAENVFEQAGGYLARRSWVRDVRHPVPKPPRPAGAAATLAKEARAAIAAADKLARRLRFDRPEGPEHAAARAAYRDAFGACAAVLREVPLGFQLPWFKRFWQRNEEALKVLSVVRAVQEDLDDVRRWLTITSGGPYGENEQAVLETIVRTLFYFPEDRAALLKDPLCRLLIDPEPGHYDMTIVSAMGVVTDGEKGRELEDAYRRLEERRGVRVIRAHTGLFRSLEYNAAAIIRAVQETTTPWGYIGYSQGCPNGLLAESFLYTGTPAQREIVDRFVGRNLLFSAANGSVHGTSGGLKFLRAMVDGERFLKHYQASYSREAVEMVLRGMRAFMDSAAFVNTLGGTHSLSLERARVLNRDRQCVPWAPTSTTRGVITPERIPEALEYLFYVHERLLPGEPCDSQVAVTEEVGQATRITNLWTESLARCDMGSYAQWTHHWSPLTAEIEFITTARDLERAVYQSPKDRHVTPWLDVNARFGRIRLLPVKARRQGRRGSEVQ
ncbi:MAG TPA: hypothetical protein VGQ83_39475 [Polyangia bacterium]|jgi:hypothetical protein